MRINRKATGYLAHSEVLMIESDRGLRSSLYQHTQRKKAALERMATIGETVCSISHDLRHSLSAIYANAELMERPNICAHEQAELIHEVQQAVISMTELIDSLLQFANDGRRSPLVRERISRVIDNAITLVKRRHEGQSVSIVRAMPSMAEASIDMKRLESAIYNLLLNACQAAICAGNAPAVAVDVEEIDNYICITITDNGIGVPSSIKTTLFDPFVTSGKHNGTGLGLAMARQVAEEHGGSVYLKSSNRGKTVFTLTLKKNMPEITREQLTTSRESAGVRYSNG